MGYLLRFQSNTSGVVLGSGIHDFGFRVALFESLRLGGAPSSHTSMQSL